jgi:predicted small lipoprotein YifL
MKIYRGIVALLALTMFLTACGRPGPVRPPGPPQDIKYPRPYPSTI